MRKHFEGLSFTGGVLLFSVFLFAIFLRFFDLGSQSPWTDELASWFFLRNLNQVFLYESHSPFYYFLLRLFLGDDPSITTIRAFSGFLSISFLVAVYFLGIRFLEKNKVIALIILLALSPSDIVYARMARHYSFLLEGSLLFLFLIKANVRTWIVALTAFCLGFIHIFALIPIFVILIFEYFEKKDLKRNLIIAISSLGIVFYYVVRLIAFGSKRVGENVTWNSSDFTYFAKSTITQFLGDAYPRLQFFPTSFYFASAVVALMFGYALIRKKKSLFLFVGILISSILFIELINLGWINLRINRYVIYLSGFLIYAFVDALPTISIRGLLALFVLATVSVLPLNLTTYYPWDDEVVREWKEFSGQHPEVSQFVCMNKFQSAYYKIKAPELCRMYIGSIDTSKPLLFFDLNNNDSAVAMFIMDRMRPLTYKNFSHSRIIHFEPR